MNKLKNLVERLKEPSSWAAIASAMLALGISVDPGLWQHLALAGTGVSGLLAFFMGEKGPTKPKE
jgi:hypothetical protein